MNEDAGDALRLAKGGGAEADTRRGSRLGSSQSVGQIGLDEAWRDAIAADAPRAMLCCVDMSRQLDVILAGVGVAMLYPVAKDLERFNKHLPNIADRLLGIENEIRKRG